jgi:hypothetical protein
METVIWVAVGAIVLLAFVLVLRRLARDAEPVKVEAQVWRPTHAELRAAYAEDGLVYEAPRGMSSDAQPPSWQEQERTRKARREQERERKRRQKQRRKLKGGRS